MQSQPQQQRIAIPGKVPPQPQQGDFLPQSAAAAAAAAAAASAVAAAIGGGGGGGPQPRDPVGTVPTEPVVMCQCLSVLDPFPVQTAWRYVQFFHTAL